MTISNKHAHQSVIVDDGSDVGSTVWNAEHNLTMATGKILGRTTAGDGAVEEIAVGSGLSLSAGTLSATGGGGGGSPGGSDKQVQYNNSSAFGGAAGVTIEGTGQVSLALGALGGGAKTAIDVTATTTGGDTFTGLKINLTNTGVTGNFLEFINSNLAGTAFSVSTNGDLIVGDFGQFQVPAVVFKTYFSAMYDNADGVIVMSDSTFSTFTSLVFGTADTSGVSFKKDSTTIQARLGDDSDFINLQGKLTTEANAISETITPDSTITLYDAAGTAYKVPCVAA